MLVLTRRVGEAVRIDTSDGPIYVAVSAIDRGKIRLGIDAPKKCLVLRTELLHAEDKQAEPKEDPDPDLQVS